MFNLSYLYKSFIIASVTVSVSACATIAPSTVSISQQTTQKTFKISKVDFEGAKINNDRIISAIDHALCASGYNSKDEKLISYNAQYGSRSYSESGVESGYTTNSEAIKFRYYNGTRFYFDNRDIHAGIRDFTETTDVFAKYPVKFTSDDNFNYVILSAPISLDIVPKKSMFAAYKQYATTPDIINDVNLKFNGVSSIAIPSNYTLKGECNSKYDTSSIYANFDRVLGKFYSNEHVAATDLEKKNAFKYKHNDDNLRIQISVFPYRNGSKVVYELPIPYNISDTISLTKNDIDQISKEIENIVNN